MTLHRPWRLAAALLFSGLRAHPAAAQLMSTCVENSPERRGELGCTIVESKLLPAGLKEPVVWHIDRFGSVERAREAAGAAGVAFEAAGTAWLMTIEASASGHHGGEHVAEVGPLPLPPADRYAMVVQSAVFAAGMYSLPHHHSGVEAVYVLEGDACYETPGRGFSLSAGEAVMLPAGTPMRAVVPASTKRRHVLAVIVHDASQPSTMRMAEGAGPELAPCQSPAALDTARIERLTGAKGALDAKAGVFKVSVPRDDLSVTAAGVRVTPPMGLTSWAAFQRAGAATLVMGDLVLLEDQVNPVMSAALDAGLEVTALHNHFFWDSPRVMFMHIGGSGDEERLASAVGRVFARMKETAGGAGEVPRGGIDPAKGPVTAARIDAILGRSGTMTAGVYKVVIGRTARMHGAEVGAAMGVNTWAAFAGSDERAAVDGDFAMLESELQPVLKALRRAGILVVAIHQHMTHEEPRTVFLHYWGVGRAEDLATGLKAALDATGGERRADAGGVVFVCEHGSVKSLIAAEWFNRLAAERGLAVRAVSRGLTPDAAVPPAIVGALAADGFDVHGYLPRALGDADLAGTRVVALGAALERPGLAVERWDAIPPATERYEESRTAIRQRVEALLDRIQSRR